MLVLTQPEQRQDGEDDDHETDKINDAVHGTLLNQLTNQSADADKKFQAVLCGREPAQT
jgi:hypothetical protein